MKISRILTIAIVTSLLIGLSRGTLFSQIIGLRESQLRIRSMQTRAFDTADENKTLRAIIATLQDFGFVIRKANEALGTITAVRIDKYPLRMTVTVRSKGGTQVLVRMNLYLRMDEYNSQPVRDPIIYQDFFTSLEKSMFLVAHSVY